MKKWIPLILVVLSTCIGGIPYKIDNYLHSYRESDSLKYIDQDVARGSSPYFSNIGLPFIDGYVKLVNGKLQTTTVISPFTFSYPLSESSYVVSLLYNSTNLKINSNQLDTIQNISAGSSPTFVGATLSGMSIAGYVKNNASGILSGGNTITTQDVQGIFNTSNYSSTSNFSNTSLTANYSNLSNTSNISISMNARGLMGAINVDSNGNVGVGTTNPTQKFVVSGNAIFIGIVTANSFVGNGYLLTNVYANTTNLSLTSNYSNIANTSNIAISMDARGLFGAIRVVTNNIVMLVSSNGGVAIGTTTINNSSATKLHLSSIAGPVLIVDSYVVGSGAPNIIQRKARGTENAPSMIITGDFLGGNLFGGYTGDGFINGSSAIRAIANQAWVDNTWYGSDLAFYTSQAEGVNPATEKLRITGTGNIGINTTTPNELLVVNGNQKINGYLNMGTDDGSYGLINLSTSTKQGLNINNNGQVAIGATSYFPVGGSGGISSAISGYAVPNGVDISSYTVGDISAGLSFGTFGLFSGCLNQDITLMGINTFGGGGWFMGHTVKQAIGIRASSFTDTSTSGGGKLKELQTSFYGQSPDPSVFVYSGANETIYYAENPKQGLIKMQFYGKGTSTGTGYFMGGTENVYNEIIVNKKDMLGIQTGVTTTNWVGSSWNLVGSIADYAINAGGTGYITGDVLTLTGGTAGTFTVTARNSTGVVTGISLTTIGSLYAVSVDATTGGTGSGCKVSVNTLYNPGIRHKPGEASSVTLGVSLLTAGAIKSGRVYEICYRTIGRTAGTITPRLGTATATARGGNSLQFDFITANADNVSLNFLPLSTYDGSVYDISLRDVSVSGYGRVYSPENGNVNISIENSNTENIVVNMKPSDFAFKVGYSTNFVTKNINYTISANDCAVVGVSLNALTFTLPATTGSGKNYFISNIGTGNLTVTCNGVDKIKGNSTQTLYKWEAIHLIDIGINTWLVN